MLNKLHVNIPFIDALSQVPLYAEFVKQILSKNRKVDEHETITLGEEWSVIVLNKLLTRRIHLSKTGPDRTGPDRLGLMIEQKEIREPLTELNNSRSRLG